MRKAIRCLSLKECCSVFSESKQLERKMLAARYEFCSNRDMSLKSMISCEQVDGRLLGFIFKISKVKKEVLEW